MTLLVCIDIHIFAGLDFALFTSGGGIHGVSIAYHLATQFNLKSTIIESTSLAAAASGKSGGFLARGWGSGPTQALHEVSFDMHADLARELSVTSYRRLTTLEVDANIKRKKRKSTNIASWLNTDHVSSSLMDENTAQVTSMELVQRMWEAAEQQVGAELVVGRAVGLDYDENDLHVNHSADGSSSTVTAKATGVKILVSDPENTNQQQEVTVPADVVVLAMGPWTSVAVEDWCGYSLPMEGIKSTSLIFHNMSTLATEEPYALFCAEDAAEHCHLEVYPRSNGDVYVCGIGGSDHVSGDRLRYPLGDCRSAEEIHANPARVQAAYRALSRVSTEFESRCFAKNEDNEGTSNRSNNNDSNRNTENDAKTQAMGANIMQACMRPCTSDGLPVMGLVPDTSNVYISTGHNCWGILWAPVCGRAMSELLVLGKARCVDLQAFEPARLLRMTAAQLRRRKHWKLLLEEQHKDKGSGKSRDDIDDDHASSQNQLNAGTLEEDKSVIDNARGRKKGQHMVGEQW